MGEFIYKQMPYKEASSLKNSLSMKWEDGKDLVFGMDRGSSIKEFDEKLYQSFRRANDRIEMGENPDKVFFDFIYDGYSQPQQLYWRDATYFWKPEAEGDSPAAGVGFFILKTLWNLHPEYDLWRDYEKEKEYTEEEEAINIFNELLENKCLSAYAGGCPINISEKAKSAIENAEKLFDKGEDIKSRDIVRHEMIDSLYQAGYELSGRAILVTDYGTYSGMEELRQAMKERLNQSAEDFLAFTRSLIQETFIDQRFYNWLVYTQQLERFYRIYEIDFNKDMVEDEN